MNLLLPLIVSILFTVTTIYADNISQLAQKLNLQPGTKASIQWKRVFSSPRHMKKYQVDSLSFETRIQLENYLIKHAADSDQPIVPGL